jgi:iron complex outermembrane receptor protein
MKLRLAVYITALLVCCAALQGWCEEAQEKFTMEEVVVEGKQERGIFEAKTTQPDTESTVNREGIKLYGGAGQISPFKAVDILPSVNYQSADGYGLTNNQSIRVRGQSRVGSTVEGLSLLNYGLTPGVSDQWLFDMENLSSISLYRGAVGPEKSFAPYNTGGTVDRILLRPTDKIGFTLSESHGSYNFNKLFTRFDSGLLPSGTKMFFSFSKTGADNWKGSGDFKSDILSFGISQKVSSNVKVELFGTYGNPESNAYRSLTYAQSRDLSAYNRYGYSDNANRSDYYDYNKSSFINSAFFSNIEIKTPGDGKVTLKPYYARERGRTLTGITVSGRPGVREWVIRHDMFGLVAQYDAKLLGTDFTLGYWYCNQEPPGPPTAQKLFVINNNSLRYTGRWAILADPTENHEWHSPYISLGKQFGSLYVKGGLRYVYEKAPSIDLYNSTNVPDVSLEDTFGYTTVDPSGSVRGEIIRKVLPNFGINYAVTKQLNTYFNYGKNIGRPAFDTWYTYAKNRAAFTNRGLTAQYLWRKIKPEISDHFDLGARYNTDLWSVGGTVFYVVSNDKSVSVADPNLGGIRYSQNVGEAMSYGAELEISRNISKDFNIFAVGSYNKYEFTKDIHVAANSVTKAKGNQVPDVPVYEARVGATYRFCDFAFTSALRYTGKRYGDVENNEHVSAFTVVDADIRYTKENIWNFKSITAGLAFYNLFNTRYISVINVSDDTRQGSASYYTGAPLTVVGRLEFKF